jgi:hypothetical protein
MSSWASALDDFEARLVAQRDALDAGEAGQLPPFVAGIELGPLPPELEVRARELLAQSDDLVHELHENVTALGQDLAVVRTLDASTARPAQANFVDFSA